MSLEITETILPTKVALSLKKIEKSRKSITKDVFTKIDKRLYSRACRKSLYMEMAWVCNSRQGLPHLEPST